MDKRNIATLTIFSTELCETIREKIESTKSFTTVTDNEPSNISPIALGFICLDTYITGDEMVITHVGIIRKNMRVATGQVRLNVTDVFELPRHLSVDTLSNVMPRRLKKTTKNTFSIGYKKASPKTGEEILKKIREFYPDKNNDFERLLLKLSRKKLSLSSPRIQDAANEKDALGIALDIFGINRSKILANWNGNDVGKSFLSGIGEYTAYEDDIIHRDLRVFPGMDVVRNEDITGVVEFENKDGEKLIVINANRKPLEKATGVDLIYLNRQYNAFVFVQYKMMEKNSEDAYYFYTNNQAYEEELNRMVQLMDRFSEEPISNSLIDYRFSNCPLFFKVCRRIQMKQNDGSLTAGAYISFSHWNILLKDESTLGPRGGRRIGFQNLNKRYITNQIFVDLVRRGLIGTQTANSEKIGRFLEAAIIEGRSVMYAIDESLKHTNPEDDLNSY